MQKLKEEGWLHQTVQFVAVINQNLLKTKEASSSLSSLIIRTPLSQISLVGIFCFKGVTKLIKNIKWTKQ